MQNSNQPYSSKFYPEDRKTGPTPPQPGNKGNNAQGQEGTSGNKNSTGSESLVQLPKGGGAIKGIGEKFDVNPVTGTASISVPLAISPGRQGFTPQLGLSYNSGGGNSPFGLGWSVGIPSISRKTDKGLPKYQDANESDTFLLSGAEDLVPKLELENGDWIPVVDDLDTIYTKHRYIPRTEGLWAKIEKWVKKTDGDTHWRATTKENVTTVYGESTDCRIADPVNDSHVFQWMIERTYDNKGNVIYYKYKAEDDDEVTIEINEKQRWDGTEQLFSNLYLKSVHYGNTTPYNGNTDPASLDYLFQLVFDYGEHDLSSPGVGDNGKWSVRQDPFSSYRAGFEIRTYRSCKRVLMFHNFTELGSGFTLVKSTDLAYSENPALTLLSSVTHKGYESGVSASFPPVEFNYSEANVGTKIHSLDTSDLENLTAGGTAGGYRWIDLFGEGISGLLLETPQAWYYKPNLGDAAYYTDHPASENPDPDVELGALRQLPEKPSLAGTQVRQQLADLDGNGQTDLAILDRPSGFYEMDTEGKWEAFQYFKAMPNINWDDPNLKMIDLTGDGHADILITEQACFTVYESKAKDGYEAGLRISKELDESKGPAIVFADGTQTIFTADMSGDGLTDIVRIRNGSVDYWPNLGYGRFGKKVGMKDAPRFDHPERFDPNRIRLSDVDGTGTTDIIYLEGIKTYYWKNQAGNSWSATEEVALMPPVDNLSTVSVMDLLGNGTSCLVWSTALPGITASKIQYLELTDGRKPFLMEEMDNNMGALRKFLYAPSTKFYLRDKHEGKPWVTKLSFPVHVLERVEVFDQVTETRFVSRYAYHHGYFDGMEREFRGFGMVEQWDSELYESFPSGNLFQVGSNELDEDSHIPPVYTKTWFHTGFYKQGDKISGHYETEYFSDDNDAWLLDDTILPDGIPSGELREACRALRGSVLRREVYGLDGSNDQDIPYTTEERSYSVNYIQPRARNKFGVFQAIEAETLSYQYERDADDPRISHRLILDSDAYGNITKWAEIAYPRRSDPRNETEQEKLWVKYNEASFTNEDDNDNFYRIGVQYQTLSYEIYGLSFSNNTRFTASVLNDINHATVINFEDSYSGTGFKKRLIAHAKQFFYNEDCTAALTTNLGDIASHALPYETKTLAYTTGLLTKIKDENEISQDTYHNNPLNSANLGNLLTATTGGFELDSGKYWQISGRQTFDINNYFLPLKNIDPFGNETTIDYDSYKLLPDKITDPLNNETIVWNNYRVLQPWKIQDINLNYTAVDFDELGLVTATAIMGKEISGDYEGDDISDPTIEMDYDLHNWTNNQEPVYVHVKARETHKDANSNWLESYTYSNGLGQEIQTKVQAEDGLAWQLDANDEPEQVNSTDRWTATGRTILNNKGKVVKQYEPWFSTTHEYEDEDALTEYGVTPLMHYDPLGRPIKTELPDGTTTRVEFTAWKQEDWDQNDTVLDENNQWYSDRNSPDPDGAEPSNPDERAAWIAANHARTPKVQHFDSLGRLFLVIDDNKTETIETRYEFDINGQPLSVTDAKDRAMTHNIFNMLGEAIFTKNIDSGRRWSLTDVAGKPIYRWDNRHHQVENTYDTLQRLTSETLRLSASAFSKVQVMVYGTSTTNNLNGKLTEQKDQSGKTTFTEYDFKGNHVSLTKQMCTDYQNTIDWDNSPILETETFDQEFTYDAMNRLKYLTQPDSSIITYTYNKAGLLGAVKVKIRNAVDSTDFVNNINCNEKGQRTEIYYENGSKTTYTYDDKNFRLIRLLTTRNTGSDILQDITYTYDAVGNITEVEDDAQQTFYYSNSVIAPKGKYWYDALYRLTKATGRELSSLAMPTHTDFVDNLAVPNTASNAMQNYKQEYSYDKLGNISQMKSSVGTNWTRDYYYETANNRLKSHDGGSDVYDYDEHGNCIEMPHLPQLDWDYKDELKEVTLNAGGDKAYYIYDSSGERVRKVIEKSGGIIEERLYLGGFEVYRKTVSGTLNYERETLKITEGRNTIAQLETKTVESGNTISSPTTNQRFQYTNHLGSACLELDSNAAIISYEEYHPFGTTSYRSGSSQTEVSQKRYKYVGKERDEETGLYYYGARYYAAWIARFVSVDPLQFEYPHYTPYQYAGNKPVTYIDLDGLEEANPPLLDNNYQTMPSDATYQKNSDPKLLEKRFQAIQPDKNNTVPWANKLPKGLKNNQTFVGPHIQHWNEDFQKQLMQEHKKQQIIQKHNEHIRNTQGPVVGGGPGFGEGLAHDPIIQACAISLIPSGISLPASMSSGLMKKFALNVGVDLVNQFLVGYTTNGFNAENALSEMDVANALIKGGFSTINFKKIGINKRVGKAVEESFKTFFDISYEEGFEMNSFTDEKTWSEFAMRQFMVQWSADLDYGSGLTGEAKKAFMDIAKKYYRKAYTPKLESVMPDLNNDNK